MSQHDYSLANGDGATFRADLNAALAAILSGNSGSTAPTTTAPFMLWFDTSTGVLKQRNAGDTAWLSAVTATSQTVLGAVQGGFKNLKVSTRGLTNSSSVITADAVQLYTSASGQYTTVSAVNVTGTITSIGANGLDTGSVAASTWYYVFVIYNPTTSTTAALFSLSATAPTLPSGYTYFARVGAVRSQAASPYYLLQTLQYGRRVQYAVLASSNVAALPVMATGAAGSTSTPTWVAVTTGSFVPPTASQVDVLLSNLSGSTTDTAIAAPNNNYGAMGSTSNPPPLYSTSNNGYNIYTPAVGSMLLESTSIYWASSSTTGRLFCRGWEDNI